MSLRERLGTFPEGFRNFKQDIKLTGVPRLEFLRSAWDPIESSSTVVTLPYILYRLLFASYFLLFLTISITSSNYPGFWLLFATNWNFLSQTIYAVLNFLNVCVFWAQELCAKNHPYYHLNVNWLESTIWFSMNLGCSIPMFITVTYWIFIYGSNSLVENVPVGWSLTVHGINAILAIIDSFIVAAPFRVTHFIYPVLMNALYLLMTGIYEVSGGSYRNEESPYIYPILNWRENQVGAAVTCIAATLCITAFHFLFWLLIAVRQHLSNSGRYSFETKGGDESDERKRLLDTKI